MLGIILMTPREVSKALKVDIRTLSDWRYKKKFLHHHYKVGGNVMYDEADVLEYLKSTKID